MKRTRSFLPNALYHICSRGNNRQTIFRDHEDYMTYLSQLRHYRKKCHFSVQAYCLMPNHIHVLGSPDKFEDLSRMFQSLHRAYTEHFRKKYTYAGHLWQGRFRSGLVSGELGAQECLTYIEQNPVRAKLVPHASDYPYSSAHERLEWINGTLSLKRTKILNIH